MCGDDIAADDVRDKAMDRLPLPYSEALRLRAAGIGDPLIAEILGVERTALSTVFEIGEVKLAAILEQISNQEHGWNKHDGS